MRLTTRYLRPLLLAGFTVTVLTGFGVSSAPAAENGHVDQLGARGVSGEIEAASLNRAAESLPGTDTLPVAAAGLLVGSAGLAWVVRRSAPGSRTA